ncbi:MAG: SDR family oxidoreductase [Alphaproteobacteria bacterium]|nr:SDR family oxidoreductase [Alphaproteobacteria bacterium]
MRDLFDLTGKVAVVTGATKGIGRAIAHALAAHGAKVTVASRKADACDRVTAEIREAGGEAMAVPCNITYREQLEALIGRTREEWGQIDIVIANAAVNPFYGSNIEVPESAFEKTMTCNVRSNMWLAELVVPEMRERKDGAYVIVSSIGGLRGNPVIGTYCISKAADMQIVRNLSVEFSPDNIRFNCIAPGLVKTDFARALWDDPELSAERTEATPLRRLGEPEDIAGAAVFLASRAGAWITGQTIVVDGGVMIAPA